MSRVICPLLSTRVTTAEQAVEYIRPGDNVGMSGFTGAGYPKALPTALHDRMVAAHARGEDFRIGLWTGASTAPDADGVLAEAKGVSSRLPYNSDPTMRSLINSGEVDYVDAHLSHSAQHMWFGFYGNLDVAVVEVTAVLPNGLLVPSSSVGNNKTWLDQADRVILEVNHWQPREFEGDRVRPPGRGHRGVDAAVDQRGHREGEGDRETDIAEIQERRMDGEADILQDRVEVLPLDRRRKYAGERVGGEQDEGQEGQRDPPLHRQDVGLQSGRQVAAEAGQIGEDAGHRTSARCSVVTLPATQE